MTYAVLKAGTTEIKFSPILEDGGPMSSARDKVLHGVRQLRAEFAHLLGFNCLFSDVKSAALELAIARESSARVDGDFILYPSTFKYPANLERRRWQHTREVVKRVEPGPGENPFYLELLARQTASVEMMLRGELTRSPNLPLTKLTKRVLIATTPEPFVNASARSDKSLGRTDYVLITLFSGLIQFLYQMAKAAVLSWRLLPPPPGGTISFSLTHKDSEAVLAENPYPVELLLTTLEHYFCEGFPRDPESKPPGVEYTLPLELLITFSERFVIAHEYAHSLLHHGLEKEVGISLPTMTTDPWGREYQADLLACFLVLTSARLLDCLPPGVALQGPFFALHALSMLDEATAMVQGESVVQDQGSASHPPIASRIELLKAAYREWYSKSGEIEPDIKRALFPSETLQLLWKHARARLEILRGTAKLHPMWSKSLP